MADSMFGPDGTQDPLPPPLFTDPLAGLVTADLLAQPVADADVPRPQLVEPVAPDPELADAFTAALSGQQPDAAELAKLPPPSAQAAQGRGYVPSAPRRQVRPATRPASGRPLPSSGRPRQPAAYAGQAAKPKRGGKTGVLVMFVLVLLVIVYNLFSDLAHAISDWFH